MPVSSTHSSNSVMVLLFLRAHDRDSVDPKVASPGDLSPSPAAYPSEFVCISITPSMCLLSGFSEWDSVA